MGAAASVDSSDPVTLARARELLKVDATEDKTAGGREVVFLDWWGKLPKDADGAVVPADWKAGVEEARRTIPELQVDGAQDAKGVDGDFDLWGNLDNLVVEAAASKLQAVARGKIARRKAAEAKKEPKGSGSGQSEEPSAGE